MVALVGLSEAKAHLKLESDDDDEDVAAKLASAIRSIENRIDKSITGGDGSIDEADMPIANAAVLLMVGHLYRNRESAVIGAPPAALPLGIEWLVAPLSRMSV